MRLLLFCFCLFVLFVVVVLGGGIFSVMVDGLGCICAVSFLGSSLVAMLWTLGCLGYAEVYVARASITKGKGSGVEVISCTRDDLAVQVVVREIMFRVSSACHAGFKELTGRRGGRAPESSCKPGHRSTRLQSACTYRNASSTFN